MADVFTIDDLNALTTLTAADEVPVWDSEESGEPTKKITASNLAASVKSLASLPNTTEMNTAIQQSTATGGSDYVKLPDGTMIQYGSASYAIATSIKTYSIQFSQQFIDAPVVTVSTGAGGARVPVYVESIGKTGFELVFLAHSGTSTSWARWMAIGHWK